jgi:hypothetical protein
MVASPLEMVASIVTLGGYSSAKSARKTATVAAKTGTTQALKQGAKKVVTAAARKLDDLLAEAANAAGGEAAEAVARNLTRQLVRNAKLGVERTKRTVAWLKGNYALVRQKAKDGLYTPVVEKVKAAGGAAWQRLKAAVGKSDPPPPQGWEFSEDIFPGPGDVMKALFEELQEARKAVSQNNVIRVEKLVRACTKAGLTIDKAALE